MKRSKAHQAAVDVLRHTQRESMAYHHALVATLNKTIQRVGSVYDKGDSYVWLITFSPRMRDAIIVETFKSHNCVDQSTRVFFLEDLRRNWSYGTDYASKFGELYGKATQMQNKQYEDELTVVSA